MPESIMHQLYYQFIPPQPGQKIVAGVVERMQPLAERVFAEALKRGG